MNILVAGAYPLSQTGFGKVGFAMAKALMELDHNVSFYSINKGTSYGLLLDKIKIIPKEMAPINNIEPYVFEGEKIDLIITIGDLWLFEDIYEFIKDRAIPWVPYFAGDALTFPDKIYATNTETLNLAKMLESASAIWTYTEMAEKAIRPVTDKKIMILPHCIIQDDIGKRPIINFRNIFSIPESKKILLFVGDNIRRKGIDIWLTVLKNNPDYFGILYTPTFGPNGYDIERAIDYLNIRDRIIIKAEILKELKVSTLTDKMLIDLYKCADIFLHPHRAEGFGLCVMEALLYCKNVLASDSGGPSTYLPDNCKIKIRYNKIDQYSGCCYLIAEPDENIILSPNSNNTKDFDFQPYTFESFKNNLAKLLENEYKINLWTNI